VRRNFAGENAHAAVSQELNCASQPVLLTACIGAFCDLSSATEMRFVTVLVQMSFLNATVKHGVPRPE
jgi:response regulator of citrate/malate metabolism